MDVINIPIIPKSHSACYSARDVTALPTSSAMSPCPDPFPVEGGVWERDSTREPGDPDEAILVQYTIYTCHDVWVVAVDHVPHNLCVRVRIAHVVMSHAPLSVPIEAMSDSVEYRTLVRCRDKLITAFKLDAQTIADILVSKDLIPPNVASEIGESDKSERKANRLVDCLFSKVEISRKNFDQFITVFARVPWLKDIVEILTSTYRKSVSMI